MASVCPHCKASLEGDFMVEIEDTGQKVCAQCGAIIEGVSFQSDRNLAGTLVASNPSVYDISGTENSTLPSQFLIRSASSKSNSAGKIAGLKTVKHLVEFVVRNNRSQILQECRRLFSDLYELDIFKCLNIPKKEMLGACAVFIVCRNKGIPVTITHMSMLLECHNKSLGKMIFQIKSRTGLEWKRLDLEARVDLLCAEVHLGEEISALVKKILPLLKEAWIIEGRNPDDIIKSACYIVWQSMDIPRRVKCNFKTFALKHGWGRKRADANIKFCMEIVEVLLSLANSIPWLTAGRIEFKNMLYHLKDIIAYQKTMFHEMRMRSARNKEESSDNETATEETNISSSDCDVNDPIKTETLPVGQSDSQADKFCDDKNTVVSRAEQDGRTTKRSSAGSPDILWPFIAKRPRIRLDEKTKASLQAGDDNIPTDTFLPSTYLKSRKPAKSSNNMGCDINNPIDLDSEEITEADMSTHELENYLKTPQEVLDTRKLQMLMPEFPARTKCEPPK